MPTQAGGTLTSAQGRHTRIRWKNAARGHPQRLHVLPPRKRVSRVLPCAVTCTARDCKQPFFRLAIVQRLFLPWFGARGWAGGLAVEADAAGARTSMMVVFPLPFGPRIRVSGGLKVMACAGSALVSKARAPRRANSAPPRGHAGAQRSAQERPCHAQVRPRHSRGTRGSHGAQGAAVGARRAGRRRTPCARRRATSAEHLQRFAKHLLGFRAIRADALDAEPIECGHAPRRDDRRAPSALHAQKMVEQSPRHAKLKEESELERQRDGDFRLSYSFGSRSALAVFARGPCQHAPRPRDHERADGRGCGCGGEVHAGSPPTAACGATSTRGAGAPLTWRAGEPAWRRGSRCGRQRRGAADTQAA